jgi:cytochrome P450
MAVDLARTHPFDPALLEEPWDWYRELRAKAPVFRDPFTGIFHLASYALVLEALRDFDTFSNRFAPAIGAGTDALVADPELAALAAKSYPPSTPCSPPTRPSTGASAVS